MMDKALFGASTQFQQQMMKRRSTVQPDSVKRARLEEGGEGGQDQQLKGTIKKLIKSILNKKSIGSGHPGRRKMKMGMHRRKEAALRVVKMMEEDEKALMKRPTPN
jgi:hypothetical protein